MYLNKKIDKKFLIYSLFFFVFLLVGIYSFDDYGISIDENYHYTNGLHYYSFLKGILFPGGKYLTIQELRESFQYHHFKDPAIFDLIIAFITDLFNLENSVDIILLRHLLIFLILHVIDSHISIYHNHDILTSLIYVFLKQ